VSKTRWSAMLAGAREVGLLTSDDGITYRATPDVGTYLMAQWQQEAGADFEAEQKAAEMARQYAFAHRDMPTRWSSFRFLLPRRAANYCRELFA